MKSSSRRIRYAVVGLGHIAQFAVLPAFAQAKKNSELAALVSGDPKKIRKVSEKYGVPAVSYDEFEQVVEREQIDAAYVALPNAQHREFTERAARVGVHVLCEKPMAIGERDCRAMIRACAKANVRLMIAYRLHLTPAHLEAVALARSGKLGNLRYFSSVFGMQVKARNIRTDASDGGGPLYDLGVYCINAARYLFGDEPMEVQGVTTATVGDRRFEEIEESATAVLRFPGERVAQFTCSFNSADCASLELVGTKGLLRMDPAFEYEDQLKWTLSQKGKNQERLFPKGDQFAAELIYFSNCILRHRDPEPDGNDGLADVRIVEAILRSAKTGRAVKIKAVRPQSQPRRSQRISRPPGSKRGLVKSTAPHS